MPTGQAALPVAFCKYGDKIVTTLETVFDIPATDIFEFELDAQTGGAHTGTACNHFGDGVAYDAFSGSGYGATGFWGYLLSLHEAVNDWTGISSGGWPTDWWADHQSAFPNLMDFHVMNTIGVDNGDQNLIKAAGAQKKRFYPGGDSADPKVVALDNVFLAMPAADGYAGFSHMFKLQSSDGVKWDNLGVANPNVKRSEYVAAYMSLAVGQNALPLLQGPGKNGGGNICNGTPDGTASDTPYACSASRVDAIASAHCAALASAQPQVPLATLRKGQYENVPSALCGKACPAECGCDSADHCVPAWLAPRVSSDAGSRSDAGSDTSDASIDSGPAEPDAGPRNPPAPPDQAVPTPSDSGVAEAHNGTPQQAHADGSAPLSSNSDAGCSCHVNGRDNRVGTSSALVAMAGALTFLRRTRRRRQ